ncbi:MAG: CopD family protein [Methylicorpusculum sp.]|uniref:CopD family protein n=1 Tax=Methylicorpusculum sp. TaxID=2713644 RepID=UPI0027180761|nr:CopD family protein [Methylicorpusculum sp.]MDO8939488.1 CopD family protein [Methylicorpusculum sp.]MDP2200631.1 CopD family protein [Methylicorpusculum sp.]
MLWLLLLHISSVVCWCGSLLYLPALITGAASQHTDIERERQQAMMFLVYRLFSTPAALMAILSGTALFITGGISKHWLIIKLTLVAVLVLCHVFSGWMLLLTQNRSCKNIGAASVLLRIVVAILIPSIVWIVLSKPL